MSHATPSLGPCCICGGTEKVRTVIQLQKKSPTPGRGWGCVVCHLPADGAVAVVCDFCFDEEFAKAPRPLPLKLACKGYPATDGRVPIGELAGVHKHDLSYHPESVAVN